MNVRGRIFRVGLVVLATVFAACKEPPGRMESPGSTATLARLPAPVADAFRRLDREVSAEDRGVLRATEPGEMVKYHFSLGMYVRNEYGLWAGGPLQDVFLARGVRHPDDMSDLLLEAYGLYLRGAAVNLGSIIRAMPPPPQQGKFEEVSSDSASP